MSPSRDNAADRQGRWLSRFLIYLILERNLRRTDDPDERCEQPLGSVRAQDQYHHCPGVTSSPSWEVEQALVALAWLSRRSDEPRTTAQTSVALHSHGSNTTSAFRAPHTRLH
ncbi:hypothetical protein E2C01_001463 [Portunus trituberculatus]|uniref:Uncharacterized protein n=1 Tax=Portunus trituberculatus TaxID=210409 RepID=A0A5B7CI18_PORTR|nr:hypothetical protein [Portunus trituberculatus]